MAKYIEEGNLEELNVAPELIVVFDCETTGLDKDRDEMLQISLIDGNGEVLLDTYLKPKNATSWPGAQAVHGITPEMVADAPDFSQFKKQVEEFIRGADLLIGYNLSFDLGFVRAAGVTTRRETKQFDVMKEYAPVHGEWASFKNDWKWPKLEQCAKHYGHTFQAHNSLEDAKVTLQCFRSMLSDNAPGGYLALCGDKAALHQHDYFWYDKDDPNAQSRYQQDQQRQYQPAVVQQAPMQKKTGKGFYVLVGLAVLFIVGAIGGAGVGAFLIGAICAVVAFLMKRKK